MKALVPYKL